MQRLIAHTLLRPNYGVLPGVNIRFENAEQLPRGPVVYAMNHTDRYNYFPFQYQLYRTKNRFTATWVKGKYYENAAVGTFMEITNNIPTVSRGYLIVRDFLSALGRHPNEDEYRALRQWVDAVFHGEPVDAAWRNAAPSELVTWGRNILGYSFNPGRESWAQAIVQLYGAMMGEFRRLNQRVFELGLDLLVFPEGTRSVRLSSGRTGLAQLVLHHQLVVVPVGCNGSHRVYPGDSPWAKKGDIVYRVGEPITPEAYAQWVPAEPFVPFTASAEHAHKESFEGFTSLLMERIEALLDPEHRPGDTPSLEVSGSRRFV